VDLEEFPRKQYSREARECVPYPRSHSGFYEFESIKSWRSLGRRIVKAKETFRSLNKCRSLETLTHDYIAVLCMYVVISFPDAL